jgi:membrane protease YdiL (CAAX protease family)
MNVLLAFFWNARERRLPVGWRLLVQLILFVVVLLGAGITGALLGKGAGADIVTSVLYLAAGLGAAWLLARFVDRRPFAAYGFHTGGAWWADLGFGLALGAVLMTGVFLTEYLAGWVTVTGAGSEESGLSPAAALLVSVLVYTAIAFNEEFAFRGYQLRNLAEGLAFRRVGPRAAVVIALLLTSALFGLAHALNPGATWVSTFNIVLLAGVLLSLPYVLTGELAVPIGLHLTWNLFQGTVYGFPVSGSKPSRRLFTIEQGGPDEWTGGNFGPEAGLVALVWMLVGCGLVLAWVKLRRDRLALDEALAHYEPRVPPAPGAGAYFPAEPEPEPETGYWAPDQAPPETGPGA